MSLSVRRCIKSILVKSSFSPQLQSDIISIATMKELSFNVEHRIPLLKQKNAASQEQNELRIRQSHLSPSGSTGNENGLVYFVGTATTVIEWQGFRILTDPNFLHAGDHVHLGPGVNATRQTNPAVDLEQLPPIDCILLSHYHEDHFDRLVERSLNRSFPIITTPHAYDCLALESKQDEPFTNVTGLSVFETCMLRATSWNDRRLAIKVTGMPGKHVPPGPLAIVNDFLKAVPPTNGWMIELGQMEMDDFKVGYRIYISGDTLFVDELKDIPKWLGTEKVDLMLAHLGGTTIPGPSVPLIMVTMDAKQGLQLMELINPDVTIPIHVDDYDVFLSSLDEFKEAVAESASGKQVVYLNRGDAYHFEVKG